MCPLAEDGSMSISMTAERPPADVVEAAPFPFLVVEDMTFSLGMLGIPGIVLEYFSR